MGITAARTIPGPHGNGRTQVDIACDGPGCPVTITTDPWRIGDELATWTTVDVAIDDDDEGKSWFHRRSCFVRWAQGLQEPGTFQLRLECVNDAFCDADTGEVTLPTAAAEVASILRNAAGHLERGAWASKLLDFNGNTVGEFRLTPPDETQREEDR